MVGCIARREFADPPDAADAAPDDGLIDAPAIDAVDASRIDAVDALDALAIDAIDAPAIDAIDAPAIDAIDAVPIDAVPIDAVPIDAVPIDAVPIDAVPIDAVPIDAPIIDTPIIDTPIIDAPTVIDGDGDGIPDVSDNCPTVFNAHQDDADGDLVGDVCDRCPQLTGQGTNAEGDGIATECGDPDIGSAQCIVWFDGFGRNTMPRYTASGAWTMSGGLARQTSTSGLAMLSLTGGDFAHPYVRTGGTIVQLGTLTGLNDVHAFGARANQGGAVYTEGVIRHANGAISADAVVALHYQGSPGTLDRELPLGAMLTPGAAAIVAIDVRIGGPLYAVRVAGQLGAASVGVSESNLSNLVGGTVALETDHVNATFDYVLVLAERVGPSCPLRVEP